MRTSDVDQRVDDLLRMARGQDDRAIKEGLTYADCDLDDDEVISRLRAVSRIRPPTLTDLDLVLLEIEDRHRREMQRSIERIKACHERRNDLKVFYIYNTADRKLVVLAKDAACARDFAFHAGHIKERQNGRVMVLKPDNELKLRKSGDALGRALRDGMPGVVKQLGENVVMEGTGSVFTPMTVVTNPPD